MNEFSNTTDVCKNMNYHHSITVLKVGSKLPVGGMSELFGGEGGWGKGGRKTWLCTGLALNQQAPAPASQMLR